MASRAMMRKMISASRNRTTLENGSDQWLGITELSTPPGFFASPLHRVVLRSLRRRHRQNGLSGFPLAAE